MSPCESDTHQLQVVSRALVAHPSPLRLGLKGPIIDRAALRAHAHFIYHSRPISLFLFSIFHSYLAQLSRSTRVNLTRSE